MEADRSEHRSFDQPLSIEERQWVRRVREDGDRSAFEQLFRTYYRRLHGFAYSYVDSVSCAEDIVQTVFLRIWAQREELDPPGTVKQYLFAAVRNESLNLLRHRRVVDETEAEVVRRFVELKSPSSSAMTPEAEELERAIRQGIDQLPDRCRTIFLLNRQSGLTYAEIASFLDISVNTVTTQMGRALHSLRIFLSDYLPLLLATCLPEILI